MKNKEQLAEQYAEEQNSAYTNDYNGFINGWDSAVKKNKNSKNEVPSKNYSTKIQKQIQ